MSNIYALIVAAPSTAKKYCREGASNWELRSVRARYGMKEPKNESLRSKTVGGCYAIITIDLYPVMLRTLLRVIRDESYDDFPYPAKTYKQEKLLLKKVDEEVPYVYGDTNSAPPLLWQIPQEIVEHLAEIETKKEISELARQWQKTFDKYTKPWCTLKVTENLLKDLQYASVEAVRIKKKAFLYCST